MKHPSHLGPLPQRALHLPLLSALFLSFSATSSYAGVSAGASALAAAQNQGILTVNTTDDHYDGTCSATDCSLREAITAANKARAPRTIQFHIPRKDAGFANGVFTIKLKQSLPSIINDKTAIDGSSQTLFGGDTSKTGPEVVLDGSSSSGQSTEIQNSGLWIRASNCVVQGLGISGFRYAGIAFVGKGCAYNRVRGCYLGADAANVLGIAITQGSHDNLIGGTTATVRNIISNNSVNIAIGISTKDNKCYGNRVQGNFVGTDRTGTGLLFGGIDNYSILVYGHDNAIGGAQAGAGNVVCGEYGIEIYGTTADGNRIQGNYVGVNATGKKSLPGTVFGIYVQDGNRNLIGGEQAGAGNVVAGCQKVAIGVQHNRESKVANAGSRNVIQGNFVGTDKSGTLSLPNECNAVQLIGTSYTQVGGTRPGARNILASSKAGVGIFDYDLPPVSYHGVGNIVQGNYIGTDVTGKKLLPNTDAGIAISNSEGTVIGGTRPGAGNLISGNAGAGISLFLDHTTFTRYPNAEATQILGNTIGTDVTGTRALGNQADGITIQGGVGTIIGGTAVRARNLISGNKNNGITIDNDSIFVETIQRATGVQVRGNFIGTDVKGTGAIGNVADGIKIEGATGTTIGGTGAAGNLISGNTGNGVTIIYDEVFDLSGEGTLSASQNQILGNIIGTDATGNSAVANGGAGVAINNSVDNTVGGTAPGTGNLISGNLDSGILIGGMDSTDNKVWGNTIGSNADETQAIENLYGVTLFAGASNNIIGGTDQGAGNAIAGNNGAGVIVFDDATRGNTIRGNTMHVNIDRNGDNIGIVLFPSEDSQLPVPNDAQDGDDGPNRLQNFPVLQMVTTSNGSIPMTRLMGTLNSTPNKSFVLDFYNNPKDLSDATDERAEYASSITVKTDAEGNATFALTVRGGEVGDVYTATATDLETGDTSAFSEGQESSAQPTPNSPATTVPSGGKS